VNSIPDMSADSPYFWPMVIGGAVLFILLMRVRVIGVIIRTLVSLALLAIVVVILLQRAPFDPMLSGITDRLNLDGQKVVGEEVRIRMSPDGHFRANVTINGVRRKMLIDSGATVTALSPGTAQSAGLEPDTSMLPVVLQTANGATAAQTSTIDELRIGNIVARDLRVVVSPGLGNVDLLGMNFLSKLRRWSVEGRTLILVPHHPQDIKT
jgi:aspartyl protease family protein